MVVVVVVDVDAAVSVAVAAVNIAAAAVAGVVALLLDVDDSANGGWCDSYDGCVASSASVHMVLVVKVVSR